MLQRRNRNWRCRLGAAIFLLLAMPAPFPTAFAKEGALGPVTNLPLPRYVSLRSSEINIRRGPGLNYPIDWVFRRAGLPVKIVEEFGDWRRVIDSDGAGGWVYHALLTGRRTVLVTAPDVTIREDPAVSADPVALLQQGVVARLRECDADWCEVEIEEHRGWSPTDGLWGTDVSEPVAE